MKTPRAICIAAVLLLRLPRRRRPGCPAGSASWATATPTSTSSTRPIGARHATGSRSSPPPAASTSAGSPTRAAASRGTGGFAYNWARSDATTEDLIAAGQHTGLARQIARGEVRLAVVFIGGNDFINALKGPDPEAALASALPRALANHRLAVETLLAADPEVRLVLATLPDVRHLPEFAGPIAEGRLPRRLADASTAAIRRFNAQVRGMAASDPRIALADLDTGHPGREPHQHPLRARRRPAARSPPSRRTTSTTSSWPTSGIPAPSARGCWPRCSSTSSTPSSAPGSSRSRDAEVLSFARSLVAPSPRDPGARLAGLP